MANFPLLQLFISSFSFFISQKKQDTKAPDKDAILKATASLPTRHTDRTVTQHNIRDVSRRVPAPRPPGSELSSLCFYLSPQFQTELRKILVSLIEVAQKLLALNPDAVELFKKANGEMVTSCYAYMLENVGFQFASDRK